jgi:hypothetical protein
MVADTKSRSDITKSRSHKIMCPVFGAWCGTLVNRQRLNIARSRINLFTSSPITLTTAPLPSQTGKNEAIRTLIIMSVSPLPSRASSPAYSDFELDDAQADFTTAFTLRDQPGLAGPVESITPRDVDDSFKYSSDSEDPFDVPIQEWVTVFPDEYTCYESLAEVLEAL